MIQGLSQKAYKKLDAFNNKKMIKIANAKPVYKDGKFEIQKEEEVKEQNLKRCSS